MLITFIHAHRVHDHDHVHAHAQAVQARSARPLHRLVVRQSSRQAALQTTFFQQKELALPLI
jgi:hypothetical protein